MLKAILCDMDGTLIETEFANATAYCCALAEFGVTLNVHDFMDNYSGMSWKAFLPMIAPSLSTSAMLDIAERKKLIYKNVLHETSLKENIVEMVRAMKKDKLVALVTTASRSATDSLLDYHKLHDLFDITITGDDVALPKPSPVPYLSACDKLGVNIKECIILEDSDVGIRSARSSGATVLVVSHE